LTLENIKGKPFGNPPKIIPENANHTQHAEAIMQDYRFKTLSDTDEVLVYENGVYKFGGEVKIKEECEKRIKSCNIYMVNQITATIKRSTYINRNEFDQDPDIISLKNGMLNIKTGEFSKFNPNILCRNQIPVVYDPKSGPIKFIKFLMDCLPDFRDRITIIEEFASTLIKQPNFEKVSMYIGGGSNGKSTFLKLISRFLGLENIASVSIHDLTYSRFAPARLDGKLANIYSDIVNTELKQLGRFKALVSGDPIDAEKKGKDAFTLINKAKMFYSANQIPEIDDDSDAVFRRFLITEWTQQFGNEPDVDSGIYQKDTELLDRLCTEKEFSGILNLLLFTVKRLLKKNKFTFEQTIEQVRKTMKERADPILLFCNNCLVVDPKAMLAKKIIYRKYCEWSTENKQIIKPDRQFNAKLNQIMNVMSSTQKVNGKATKVWMGVKFNESVTGVTSVTNLDSY